MYYRIYTIIFFFLGLISCQQPKEVIDIREISNSPLIIDAFQLNDYLLINSPNTLNLFQVQNNGLENIWNYDERSIVRATNDSLIVIDLGKEQMLLSTFSNMYLQKTTGKLSLVNGGYLISVLQKGILYYQDTICIKTFANENFLCGDNFNGSLYFFENNYENETAVIYRYDKRNDTTCRFLETKGCVQPNEIGSFRLNEYVYKNKILIKLKVGCNGIETKKHASKEIIILFDGKNGKVVWERKFPSIAHYFQIDNKYYLVDRNNTIYSINMDNGEIEWHVNIPNYVATQGQFILYQGTLYIVAWDRIILLDQKNGNKIKAVRIKNTNGLRKILKFDKDFYIVESRGIYKLPISLFNRKKKLVLNKGKFTGI